MQDAMASPGTGDFEPSAPGGRLGLAFFAIDECIGVSALLLRGETGFPAALPSALSRYVEAGDEQNLTRGSRNLHVQSRFFLQPGIVPAALYINGEIGPPVLRNGLLGRFRAQDAGSGREGAPQQKGQYEGCLSHRISSESASMSTTMRTEVARDESSYRVGSERDTVMDG